MKKFKYCERRINLSEYNAWVDMKSKCLIPTYTRYYKFGGIGVTICDAWLRSFTNFINDMGSKKKYNDVLTLKNPTGQFNKENCYWRPNGEDELFEIKQLIEYKGKSYTLKKLAAMNGWNSSTLQSRLYLLPIDAAMDKSIKPKEYILELKGEKKPLLDWIKEAGITLEEFKLRRKCGWGYEDSFENIHQRKATIDGIEQTIEFWLEMFMVTNPVWRCRLMYTVLHGGDFVDALKRH